MVKIKNIHTLLAAERKFGIARSTIRSAIDRKELPDHRLGSGEQVVIAKELRAWDKQRKSKSAQ